LLQVEFHCHTIYSKDSLTSPAALLAACARRGLDRVIITDHNTIAGALEAQRLDPLRVIVGEEIMTSQGELLAAFVCEEVPPGLTPAEAIDRLRSQGAFISVSHPFDQMRSGHWQPDHLDAILPLVDAIEIFNSRCMQPAFNQQSAEYARLHGLAGTVGSDAHTAFELGRSFSSLPDFNDGSGLKQALLQAQHHTHLSSPLVHFTSRWAVWRKSMRNKS
jgi:predicted metal-dependent phosphoesterase TrpH